MTRPIITVPLATFAVAFFLLTDPVLAATCGKASFYAEAHHGKKMANGKPFNMHAMTAASNTLPLGSKARVSHGGKSVVVTITDTGNFTRLGRIIDLSKGSFAKLANTRKGIIQICLEKL
jgi:rare lipoprotein A